MQGVYLADYLHVHHPYGRRWRFQLTSRHYPFFLFVASSDTSAADISVVTIVRPAGDGIDSVEGDCNFNLGLVGLGSDVIVTAGPEGSLMKAREEFE
jgi:hypothetical protein